MQVMSSAIAILRGLEQAGADKEVANKVAEAIVELSDETKALKANLENVTQNRDNLVTKEDLAKVVAEHDKSTATKEDLAKAVTKEDLVKATAEINERIAKIEAEMVEMRVQLAEMRGEMRGLSGKFDMGLRLIFGLYVGIIILFLTQILGG